MSAASKAIIVPQPLKKTTQIKDTIMINRKKMKFSLMKTLFSNSFVRTKPKKLQEQSNSVSDHKRNAAATEVKKKKNKDEDSLRRSSSSNKSIYNNITYEMNPYYISHKFPFYNTQMIDSHDQEEEEEDDSNKPIYDEERPPMEIVSSSFVQRKATTKEEIVEEKHDQLQQVRVVEEEEEFVNPFGKDKSSLNSCFFYKSQSQSQSQRQRQKRSSCISTNPHAPIIY